MRIIPWGGGTLIVRAGEDHTMDGDASPRARRPWQRRHGSSRGSTQGLGQWFGAPWSWETVSGLGSSAHDVPSSEGADGSRTPSGPGPITAGSWFPVHTLFCEGAKTRRKTTRIGRRVRVVGSG